MWWHPVRPLSWTYGISQGELKVLWSDWYVLPPFCCCPRKIKPWRIAIHESTVSTIVWRVGMPTNLRQQKGWEFSETPYKQVATSVYKFGTETVQLMIESWEVWTYSLISSLHCNILQMKYNTHYGVPRWSFESVAVDKWPEVSWRITQRIR